jgi:hypothetical protein
LSYPQLMQKTADSSMAAPHCGQVWAGSGTGGGTGSGGGSGGVISGVAVNSSGGVRTTMFPQAGHRARFPAASIGAFNRLPHPQTTESIPSAAMASPFPKCHNKCSRHDSIGPPMLFKLRGQCKRKSSLSNWGKW